MDRLIGTKSSFKYVRRLESDWKKETLSFNDMTMAPLTGKQALFQIKLIFNKKYLI